jgi:kynurenine formamidase
MTLVDLSQPIWDGCPNCPAHVPVRVEVVSSHDQSSSDEQTWHMESLAMTSHTGSHLDAPLHKIPDGKSLSQMPLETFTGRAFIADLCFLHAEEEITRAHLESALPRELQVLEDAIILLATGWGQKRARTDEWLYRAPFVGAEAARWIVERKIRGVGIDHYSIGGAQEPRNAHTHEILLGNGVWILEELLFSDEALDAPQPAKLWALPVNLRDHSGAWCRPVLEVE